MKMVSMNQNKLAIFSLFYYWRTNLAVMMGVIAGTAVIGGALIVGDSVRGSLEQMTLDRLGEIDLVLHGQRFFREVVADEIADDKKFQQHYTAIAPAIILSGGLVRENNDATSNRVGKVTVFAVDQRLWKMTRHGEVTPPVNDEIVINRRIANQLHVKKGDRITLWAEIPSSIPRDSLLGNRDEQTREIPLTVKAILPDELGVGRLSLAPNQQQPLTAFVSLPTLQDQLGLARIEKRDPAKRRRIVTPAKVNALFVQAKSDVQELTVEKSTEQVEALNAIFFAQMKLPDLDLRLVSNEKRHYFSLESERQILANNLGNIGQRSAETLGLPVSPVLVYLVNEFTNQKNPKAFSMYSVIAGVDFSSLKKSPFGPFDFESGSANDLDGGKIVLNEWLKRDLKIETGGKVRVKYHQVGSHGELPELEKVFEVTGIVKLDETAAADRGFTPEVEGITDKETFQEWRQPFTMDLNRVTNRDEDYWKKHRATPKAFVTLETAQALWRSRYGELTSFRVAPKKNQTLDDARNLFEAEFLKSVNSENTGFSFQAVKFDGLRAAGGTTDFSMLFLAFSFFLILSAVILIGLLFRLGIERRGTQIGLLHAVGLSPRQIRTLFLLEGGIIVVFGGLLGLLAAYGYAEIMVFGLKTWWIGAIGTKFLFVHLTPQSLVISFFATVIVAGSSIWWGFRQFRNLSARELLSGTTEEFQSISQSHRSRKRGKFAAVGCFGISALLLVISLIGIVPDTEAFPGVSMKVVTFFLVGILLLTGSLISFSTLMKSDSEKILGMSIQSGLGYLGLRNTGRFRPRSVLTTALIASATFIIVAVAAGHRNPAVEEPVKKSGNGGFVLVAESSTPILFDMNTDDGREKLSLNSNSGEVGLNQTTVMPFRVKPGEEASCLNIYQTRLPTILGATAKMRERGGFKFSGVKNKKNPWKLIEDQEGSENSVPVYPVLGDLNTLQYSLHKKIGDTIAVPSDDAPNYKLKIVGMFDSSVFQGVLVMSEENFLKVYPLRQGYQYFLVECPFENAANVASFLETKLVDYGFDAERVADRLANFLAVQNTYLSTFQTLGGLGLLLGTIGLATVMLRNVFERRSEFALLRAIGFRNMKVSLLVAYENGVLLISGLVFGTVSALLAMTPHLQSTGADVPWWNLLMILSGVFLVGMVSAVVAVRESVRHPIVSSLRNE